MPGTNVVTTLILVGAGSRYETPEIRGISHFLEHMFFKGAKKYTTPKAVAEAVDCFGGEFNAFTGKEYAGYYVKSNKKNTEKALDVLSDMLLHSRFDPVEIDKERGVILEEMAMYLDAPMYQISWDFERLVFGDQPLGWDQIGTKELIKGVTQAQFQAYQKELYTPDNMVITLAGAVDESTLELVESYFTLGGTRQSRPYRAYDPSVATERIQIRQKKTEQYHIALGVQAVSEEDPRYATSIVLGVILGGNMSSRMFQNVREDKGLCYSIRTVVDEYTDTGLLVTRAGVKLSDVLGAIEAIRYEYDHLAAEGVEEAELEKAKNYLLGKIDLRTEDTENVAHWFGKNPLLHGKTISYAERQAAIAAVSTADVQALAQEIFRSEHYRLAGIGPAIDQAALEKLLG